ncbi:hypothetical protein Lalb_Chr23g0276331 [Lupinus albus]|uniref:Uncharacterized protein n=1 Tax=Lupinus albus TaxID=3870 RepID=A0A6A4NJI4_LUPAL|nr:hypothetical protein Lalb_Chr23g0276331 [Lupinus albus]
MLGYEFMYVDYFLQPKGTRINHKLLYIFYIKNQFNYHHQYLLTSSYIFNLHTHFESYYFISIMVGHNSPIQELVT